MAEPYRKVSYDNNSCYKLHHTYGFFAGTANPAHLHYDTDLIITYFKQGSGKIQIEGRLYDISEGDFVIQNPAELHRCIIDDGKYHERLALYINEAILKNFPCENTILFDAFYKREKGIGNLIPAEIVSNRGLDVLLDELLIHTRSQKSTSEILAICKIIELLIELNEIAAPVSDIINHTVYENPVINNVLNHINEHFREKLTAEDIARHFYISKYHLSHLFKEYVGISLWDYIIFRRLLFANELMRKGYTVEESCFQSGFSNYSNFFRLYKKHMQITPSDFKRQLTASQNLSQ